FMKDLYQDITPEWFRSNTVFKFGVHSWLLLTVGAMAALQQAIPSGRARRIVFGVLAASALIFPGMTTYQFYGLRTTPALTSTMSLDSLTTVRRQYGDAANAIRWLQDNVPDRKMIVEAACESYSLCGIVAASTGNRNPIQWKTHEWGWRLTKEGSK